MHAISVYMKHRTIHDGISAITDMPSVDTALCRYIFVHMALAGDQPYRQICSNMNDSPNANAQTSHIPIVHRNSQKTRAIGVRSCSLYDAELNILRPLPLPPADKILNWFAIVL